MVHFDYIFSDKPSGLITASASGLKGHEELQLIMKTAMAQFTDETTLLIQGVKGKINNQGQIIDSQTIFNLKKFANSFIALVKNTHQQKQLIQIKTNSIR